MLDIYYKLTEFDRHMGNASSIKFNATFFSSSDIELSAADVNVPLVSVDSTNKFKFIFAFSINIRHFCP